MSEENLNPRNLVHLHVHSEYSLLDGAIRTGDLIKKAKSQGHTALAMTDHSNMFGAVEFYVKCKDAGINPIIGTEINWEGVEETQVVRKEAGENADAAFHLVLLAKTTEGYKNLCRVVSAGYLRDDPKEIAIATQDKVKSNAPDVIALSSCLHGEFAYLAQKLAEGQPRSSLGTTGKS